MHSFKTTLEFLDVVLIGFEQWDECGLILVEDRVRADGMIELCIFLSGLDVELTMQITQLFS